MAKSGVLVNRLLVIGFGSTAILVEAWVRFREIGYPENRFPTFAGVGFSMAWCLSCLQWRWRRPWPRC